MSDVTELTGIAVPSTNNSDSPKMDSAPIESGLARIESVLELVPICITELSEENAISWLWGGFLARQHVTLLSAPPKAGKTTLLTILTKAFKAGTNLITRVEKACILIVTEESKGLWKRRRDEFGLSDNIHILSRPFLGKPRRKDWEQLCMRIATLVDKHGFDVVVFDTLAGLWHVYDENDASQTTEALASLQRITETRAGVLAIHHSRKSQGNDGQAARGSSAITASCDILLELRRFDTERSEDRRRVLVGLSRFDETLRETVIELDDDGYRVVGTKADAKQADRLKVLADVLPMEAPGLSVDEIRNAWPDDAIVPVPSKRSLYRDLRQGVADGVWCSTGSGTKGNANRYSIRASSLPYEAQNESDAETSFDYGRNKAD